MTLINSNQVFLKSPADLTITKLCFIAPKFASGTATHGTLIENPTKNAIAGLFGVGSFAYKIAKHMIDNFGNKQKFAILPFEENLADTPATANQVLSGTASKAGRIYLDIGDTAFQYDFASGATALAVFTALRALINANTNCLATCDAITGTTTATMPLVSTHAGVIANGIAVKTVIVDSNGEVDNCGFTRTNPVAFDDGVGQPNIITLFAALNNFGGDIAAFADWYKQPADLDTLLTTMYENFGIRNNVYKAKRLYLLTNDFNYWNGQFDTNTTLLNNDATPLLGFISMGGAILNNEYSTNQEAYATHPYLNAADGLITYTITKNKDIDISDVKGEALPVMGNVRNCVKNQHLDFIKAHYKPIQLWKNLLQDKKYDNDTVSEMTDGNITIIGTSDEGNYVFLTPMLTAATVDKYPILRFAGGVDISRFIHVEAAEQITFVMSKFNKSEQVREIKIALDGLITRYSSTLTLGNIVYDELLNPNAKIQTKASLVVNEVLDPNTQLETTIAWSFNPVANTPYVRVSGTLLIEGSFSL